MQSIKQTYISASVSFVFATLLMCAALFGQQTVHAEGSVNLVSSGGDRAFMDFSTQVQAGLNRRTLIKAYVNAGETLSVGSSANGVGEGKIVLTSPEGYVYVSTGHNGVGVLQNNVEESMGPRIGVEPTTAYEPYSLVSTVDGIWQIEFRGPVATKTSGGKKYAASSAWTYAIDQPDNQAQIMAWDATVSKGGAVIPGRVYTNAFAGTMRGNKRAFSSLLYVLTNEGWLYTIDGNSMDPYGFIFLSNNRGNTTADPTISAYRSVLEQDATIPDPEAPDANGTFTHKLFFNAPAADLPETAIEADIQGIVPDSSLTNAAGLCPDRSILTPPAGVKKHKVTICHLPPGNPDNPRTITIDYNAFDTHVDKHGDYLGECGCRQGETGSVARVTSKTRTTWLQQTAQTPDVTNFDFVGIEGTPSIAGYAMGGFFSFDANQTGRYTIHIDVDGNGSHEDIVDLSISGDIKDGANKIFWDGKDGRGEYVIAGVLDAKNITMDSYFGEVHFPLYDAESNPDGFTIVRTNGPGAPDDTVYWDDRAFSDASSFSDPLDMREGTSSLNGTHRWNAKNGSKKGGDKRVVDTWAYIQNDPIILETSLEVRVSSLSVDAHGFVESVVRIGETLTYQADIVNNGPTDAKTATVFLSVPDELSDVSVLECETSGADTCSDFTLVNGEYVGTVTIASGNNIRVGLTGTVSESPSSGVLAQTIGVLRERDMYDAQATAVAPTTFAETSAFLVAQCQSAGYTDPVCDNVSTHSITDVEDAEIVEPVTPVVPDPPGYDTSVDIVRISEVSGTTIVSAVLTSKPSSNVTIDLHTSDPSASTLSVTSLVFTPDNWNVPQDVLLRAIDNNVANGNIQTTVTFSINDDASDDSFDTLADQSVSVTINDNDTPGITVTPKAASVSEDGANDTVTVVLDSEPTSNVTVTLSPDGNDISLGGKTLVFTPDNWNVPQVVTVSAIDDTDVESTHTDAITVTSASADTDYNNITKSAEVSITVSDNDTIEGVAGFTTEIFVTSIVELDGKTTISVKLTAAPQRDVVIDLSHDFPGSVVLSHDLLTFTATDWSVPQTVTVYAINDSIASGNVQATIAFRVNDEASDDNFDALDDQSIVVTISEDDIPGITVTSSVTSVSEGGTQDTFSIVLDSEPTGDVTVSLTPDGAQVGVAVPSVTFTKDNWNVPQSITIIATDDATVEGTHTDTITISASSTDPSYDGVTKTAVVTVTIADNDAVATSGSSRSSSNTNVQVVIVEVETLEDVSEILSIELTEPEPVVEEPQNDLTEDEAEETNTEPAEEQVFEVVTVDTAETTPEIIDVTNQSDEFIEEILAVQDIEELYYPTDLKNCVPEITEPIGEDSPASEIAKVQNLLNLVTGSNIPADGQYTRELFDAVRAYQEDNLHKITILAAAGVTEPSGLVDTYTVSQMNVDHCVATKEAFRCPYFYDYLTLGDADDSPNLLQESSTSQVNVWKEYMNLIMPQFQLEYNGVFDAEMREAVGAFQTLYRRTILEPWRFANPAAEPTFYLRETSRNWANYMVECPEGPIVLFDGSGDIDYR